MRHVDPVALRSVSNYTSKRNNDLNEAVKILLDDIKKITDVYQGEDAIILQQKYENRVNYLFNIYSTNLENVSLYLKNVSDAHSKNLEESKKKINESVENLNSQVIQTNDNITFSTGLLNENEQVKA